MSNWPFLANKRAAFTLVELLTVLAVASLLATLSAPAISSLLQGNAVSQGANLMASTGMRARQMALSSRSPVAMVLTPASGVAGSRQAVLLLISTRDSTGNIQWSLGSSWLQLPVGAQVGIYPRNGVSSFYNQASLGGVLSGNLPLQLNGNWVSSYGYIVFYPDGSIDSPEQGPTVTLTGLKVGANPDFTVVFESDSGRSKTISN